MINEKLTGEKKQRNNSGSPQAGVLAQTRKRILSPARQRFEKKFVEYMHVKEVDEKMGEEVIPLLDFDTQTKPEGTLNAKVKNK
jgi:hypothetical protein